MNIPAPQELLAFRRKRHGRHLLVTSYLPQSSDGDDISPEWWRHVSRVMTPAFSINLLRSFSLFSMNPWWRRPRDLTYNLPTRYFQEIGRSAKHHVSKVFLTLLPLASDRQGVFKISNGWIFNNMFLKTSSEWLRFSTFYENNELEN